MKRAAGVMVKVDEHDAGREAVLSLKTRGHPPTHTHKRTRIHKLLSVCLINLLKPTGHVMYQQFNIQQLYALPATVFMCFVFI